MPKPKRNTVKKPAARSKPPAKPSAGGQLAKQSRDVLVSELDQEFEIFRDRAWPEEMYFLRRVLNHWNMNRGWSPRGAGDCEVPLFSAIQHHLNNYHLVEVPPEHVREVEEFIATLGKK